MKSGEEKVERFATRANEMKAKFRKGDIKLVVIGLGYVGLPLAVDASSHLRSVVGLDNNPRVVGTLSGGESHLKNVPSSQINDAVMAGRLAFTEDYHECGDADVISICVPTPIDEFGSPDMTALNAVIDSLCQVNLKNEALIIVESTVAPGDTERLANTLYESHPLKGIMFVNSPERIEPGSDENAARNTIKVVGSPNRVAVELASLMYSRWFKGVHKVYSFKESELSKLLENTYRLVNISFVNEFAIMCDRLGVDVWNVIDAAETKPSGFKRFNPGPGIGGHCIPVDPMYLESSMQKVGYSSRFINAARSVEQDMTSHIVTKIVKLMNFNGQRLCDARVLFLGVAYKPNVGDTRETPALKIMKELKENWEAKVAWYDPLVIEHHKDDMEALMAGPLGEFTVVESEDQVLSLYDAIVITTNHDCFDYDDFIDKAHFFFDAVNADIGMDSDFSWMSKKL